MEESVIDRGILLLDKPDNLTSMQCVELAKDVLRAHKAGHSGTLDPRVTGLMLIAFNQATKAMPVLTGLEKSYEGVMKVHGTVDKARLEETARKFTGSIVQTPPRRSAVARKPRERQVVSLEILSLKDQAVSFRVTTQAGTYIRKLCHDMGEALGVGAHMASLRRTGIGPFKIGEAVTMEQLRTSGREALFPLEKALERTCLPKLVIKQAYVEKLMNGVPLDPSELEGKPPSGTFGIYSKSGSLLALSRLDKGKARPDRVFK